MQLNANMLSVIELIIIAKSKNLAIQSDNEKIQLARKKLPHSR